MRRLESIELVKLESADLKHWELVGGWGEERPEYRSDTKGGVRREEVHNESFPDVSRRVLIRNKSKLEKVLANSPYDFNVFFLRAGRAEKKSWHKLRETHAEGEWTSQMALEVLKSEDVDIESLDWKRSINFIFWGIAPQTRGIRILPPTPWIVLHWMAHALGTGMSGRALSKDSRAIVMYFFHTPLWDSFGKMLRKSYRGTDDFSKKLLSTLIAFLEKKLPAEISIDFRIDVETLLTEDLLPDLFTYGSARAKGIGSQPEGLLELFAQYIWNGNKGIVLKRPPPKLFVSDKRFNLGLYNDIVDPSAGGGKYRKPDVVRTPNASAAFRKFKNDADAFMGKVMRQSVGKWYAM